MESNKTYLPQNYIYKKKKKNEKTKNLNISFVRLDK